MSAMEARDRLLQAYDESVTIQQTLLLTEVNDFCRPF